VKSSYRGYPGVVYTRNEGSEEDKGGYGRSILKTVHALNCPIREHKGTAFYTINGFTMFAYVFEEVMRLK
jgi:hypothetical protein